MSASIVFRFWGEVDLWEVWGDGTEGDEGLFLQPPREFLPSVLVEEVAGVEVSRSYTALVGVLEWSYGLLSKDEGRGASDMLVCDL